ncbi:hypothetical protein HNR51_004226, partial [Methylorubrum thiocyanatum]|nr:hypothetical protein [Methylorubrum thiocyanatum]
RGGSLELTIRSVIGTHFHKREPLSGHLGGYFIMAPLVGRMQRVL